MATANKWIAEAGVPVEHIFSLDFSDPQVDQYKAIDKLIKNENRSVVDATNKACAHAGGDVLVYLSDDFDCFPNWGVELLKVCSRYSGEYLIKVHDGLQEFRAEVLTIPIMSKELYKALGYFWHPAYLSMWVDVDLYHTCQQRGAIKFHNELTFQHNHYCNHKSERDETYNRSDANWNQGKQVYNMRRNQGFS